MAVNLSPVGGVAAQFFTNNGTPLSGGKLYTYAAGTTTPQATYTTAGGGTAHTNPIVLDSAGRVPNGGEIWLTDGLQYKFLLKDSNDVLIATYDNITGINSNFVNYTNQQEIQTATAGQTVFTLTTMQYQPGTGSLSVFVDGVNQYGPGAQYAFLETNSTTVTFINGLHVGASVKFTTTAVNAASYGDAFQISYTPPFTSSVATNVGDKLTQTVSVKDFGAVGDGITDDTLAIQNAIAACQLTLSNLDFPPGVYNISSTITLSGNPITLISAPFGVWQQGSQRPSATLRWVGGASAMFNITSTSWRFVSLAIENFGSATCFITSAVTQFLLIEDCSFVPGAGSNRFSIAVFYATSNAFGYSKFIRNTFQGSAPYFIAINGNGATNGVTSIEIDGGLFESNSLGDACVFATTDVGVTSLAIHNATFNQQQNELCIVDTQGTPQPITINNFVFSQNEVDTVLSSATDRRFKLTNVYNASFDDNFISAGGVCTAIATLVNTVVTSFKGNYLKSCAGPFFSADLLSRIYAGANDFVVANTNGVINDSATGNGLIPLTYGTTVTILGQYGLGTGPVVYKIDVTNGTGWTLSFAHPGVSPGGFFVRGQVIAVMVRNVSGGAMGTITLAGGSTYFKLSGGAFPAPANGNSRTVWMVWDGSALVEISRTASDVPN